MAEPFVDDDADLALVQDRNIAVLGYDDQAAANALCLRDSGVDVRVGLPMESPWWSEAEADGLRVVTTYEACEEADLVVLPMSVAEDSSVGDAVRANLVARDVVVLLDTVQLARDVPEGVDVVRVAPWAGGVVLRDEFTQGRGVPAFVSVVVDGSGGAWAVALAYARAVGATRAGVIRTSDAEYLEARTYGQSTLLREGVLPLVRAAFDTLVESGCQPEVAYLQSVYALKVFADEMVQGWVKSPDADPMASAATLVRSLMGWDGPPDPRLH